MDTIRGIINQSIHTGVTCQANQVLLKLQHQSRMSFIVNHSTLLHLVATVASYIVIVIQFSAGVEKY